MRTPLEDVTYETVETISMTVSQMLCLHSALFDAANLNESKGWDQIAESIRKLRKDVIEPQCEDLIIEADRKVREWQEARAERKRWKRDEERAEALANMPDDGDNCDDGQGPREEFTTGKSECEA